MMKKKGTVCGDLGGGKGLKRKGGLQHLLNTAWLTWEDSISSKQRNLKKNIPCALKQEEGRQVERNSSSSKVRSSARTNKVNKNESCHCEKVSSRKNIKNGRPQWGKGSNEGGIVLTPYKR